MTDFIAALADLILPELMGGYAPEYVAPNLQIKINPIGVLGAEVATTEE